MENDRIQNNTLLGLGASLFLAAIKLFAGIFGHSSALVADAVESLADAVGSILVWQALRVSSRPSDDKHPYGYGKAEALASLAVGVLLVVVAIYIVIKACHEIVVPHQAPEAWTLVILILVILVKEFLFRKLLDDSSEHASDAVRADAWHHRSDAITSAAALIGVSIAIWGPYWTQLPTLVLADEAAAILASGIIVITGVQLIRPSLGELLDASAHEMEAKILASAKGKKGVVDVEKVHVRKSGPRYHADMHLHVSPQLTIEVAHALAGRVKAELIAEFPRLKGVLIHVEPAKELGHGDSSKSLANETNNSLPAPPENKVDHSTGP